jgi:hypothetical protein
MTKEHEAMKQALEALEHSHAKEPMWKTPIKNAIASLRQAIAEAEKQVSYSGNGTAGRENMTAPTGFFFQMPKAEKQESAMVKHMMEWVAFLKATSDNGQHKQIPSNLSAGACWDLAVELEQFIYTHPQPKREWVGLTLDEIDLLEELYAPPVHPDFVNDASHCLELIRHVEAKLKEKNT